jgi:hypothetical protein
LPPRQILHQSSLSFIITIIYFQNDAEMSTKVDSEKSDEDSEDMTKNNRVIDTLLHSDVKL